MRWLILIITLLWAASARADRDDDFFASSPGALSASHADLDTKGHCNDCHIDSQRRVGDDHCLKCHEPIRSNKGYHATVRSKHCADCHHEHTKADIMGWSSVGGETAFDHKLTGWPLEGGHATIGKQCAKCHKTNDRHGIRVYVGTHSACASCHAAEQPHNFPASAMLACDRCHTTNVWSPALPVSQRKFDHGDRAQAAMQLLGAHASVSCAKCHPANKFKLGNARPATCGNAGCHQSPHQGMLFQRTECDHCHSPTYNTLKQQDFNHALEAHFPLAPQHDKMRCYDCHTKAMGDTKPDRRCEECHARDSKHGSRFDEFGSPPRCQTCHPAATWKQIVFDHDRQTRFPLRFKHQQACRTCHRGGSPSDFERFDGKACMGCHQHRRAHVNKEHPNGEWKNNECKRCHVPGKKEVDSTSNLRERYHGEDSDFPLTGAHYKDRKGHVIQCEQCHPGSGKPGGTFKQSPECGDRCHADEDAHRGTLGTTCSSCHEPGAWEAPGFHHDEPFPTDPAPPVASFPLKGNHATVPCAGCHGKNNWDYTKANTTCASEGCHAEDDAHKGRLGNKCEACHHENGDNTFNHNTQSAFSLDGKHLEVRCADCHPSMTFKPRPTDCFGCHPEPRVHKGQYGTACAQCHNTRTWEDIKPLHDVGDFSSLKGAHDNIAVRALPPRQPPARGQRQPVHQLPPPAGRHPQQLAVAAVRRVPHAVVVRAGAVRSRARRLQPRRAAPARSRVLRLPQERQLRRPVADLRELPPRRRGAGERDLALAGGHARGRDHLCGVPQPEFLGPDGDRQSARVGLPLIRDLRYDRGRGGAFASCDPVRRRPDGLR